jgi:Lon protease-like protein
VQIGCCAEILHHQRLPDDRLKILTLGQQRFSGTELRAGKALSSWIGRVVRGPALRSRPYASSRRR